MTAVECAPKLELLSVENSKLINEIESESNEAGVEIVKVDQQTIPFIKEIVELKNQSHHIPTSNNNGEFNLAVEVTEPGNEVVRPNITIVNSSKKLKDNEIETSASSDWLYSSAENKFVKGNQTLNEDKRSNNTFDEVQLALENGKETVTEQPIKEETEEQKAIEIGKREISLQNVITKLLRSDTDLIKEDPGNTKTLIDGYDFNINICRYLGNRYLCGYNKNIGEFADGAEIEDLGNGCIIRGERMECGYQVAAEGSTKNKELFTAVPNVQPLRAATFKMPENKAHVQLRRIRSTLASNRTKLEPQKECFEKDNHTIVCYDIPV